MGPFEWLFLVGRILFAALFILSGVNHFAQLGGMAQYAQSKGLPAPKVMVLLSGLVLLLGGLSILFWFWVKVGAWLLVAFLLVAAFTMHNFWAMEDPVQKQGEMAQFMKNVALAGASVIFYVVAVGPQIFG